MKLNYMDTINLKKMAAVIGCENRNDVLADIKEIESSLRGRQFYWLVASNGTILQEADKVKHRWLDNYLGNTKKVFEIIVESFDQIAISEISLEQAIVDIAA